MALVWSVSNRTDGRIEQEDLELIPRFAAYAPAALVKAGLWTAIDHGWRITEFAVTQTSQSELELLENNRRREREKKARQRASKAAGDSQDTELSQGTVPGDVPGDVSQGTAQARTEQDRLGKEGKDRKSNHRTTPTGPRQTPATAMVLSLTCRQPKSRAAWKTTFAGVTNEIETKPAQGRCRC